MKIDPMNDLGAPALVTAVDIVTLETAPEYNEWSSYILAGGGFVGAMMNFGGPFVKQVGVAALPLAARALYARVKGSGGLTRDVKFNPIRQTIFPDMADVRVS